MRSIRLIDCYDVYNFILEFVTINKSKFEFNLRFLKLEDFPYHDWNNWEKENGFWVPVLDSVEIEIDYENLNLDIKRI